MWVRRFGWGVQGTININFRLRNICEVWNVYIYQNRAYQGNKNQAYIRAGFQGSENRTRGTKCKVKWKHETKQSSDTWNAGGTRIQEWMSKQSIHDDCYDPACLFWNPWNYWCLECTRNHQTVLTVMSQIRRGIKPLLQHNSGNNLIFVPWLRSVEAVYVDC